MVNDDEVLSMQLSCSLVDGNWAQAEELIKKLKNSGQNMLEFGYSGISVPSECYFILLARLRGQHTGVNPRFAYIREQLNQTVERSTPMARVLSNLAVLDALLERKQDAIAEGRRATQMLPVSGDPVLGPGIALNLAVVYAWTNELDLAFETLGPLTKTPGGIYYGSLGSCFRSAVPAGC